MFASTRCGGLWRRAFSEVGHKHVLRFVKRRRLSTLNASQHNLIDAIDRHSSYFFTNARCETFQAMPTIRPHMESVSLGGPVTPPSSVKLQSDDYLPIDSSLYKPQPTMTVSSLLKVYGQLSKSRLTFLVVLTSMSGVTLSPLPTTVTVLLSTAIGTALCSACANTLNQLAEIPFDAQMARTRMRPLVRGAISPTHAAGFAMATGLMGPAILAIFVNPIAALLGAVNIGLYAGLYTKLKRISVVNTWVGAVVGGIPPLIGWTACGGQIFPSSTYPVEMFLPPFLSTLPASLPVELVNNPLSPLALFLLLFSWQFPHFNSLAYIVRDSYAQSGYKMLSVTNSKLNALVSLRHAAALAGICSILTPLAGLTSWTFALTSLVPNAYMSRAAWRFWRTGTEKEAKTLFNISLWYLPVVMALMMLHKQGMDWLSFLGWRDKEASQAEPSHEA